MDDVCNAGLATTALLPATSLPLVMAVEIKTHIESLEKNLKFLRERLPIEKRDYKRFKKNLVRPRKKPADSDKKLSEEL